MPPSFPLSQIYASDEDLAVRAVADYDDLIPYDQVAAIGSDGVVAAGAWTLSSASIDFGARGVRRFDMVKIWGRRNTTAAGRFGGETQGHWFAIESVDGGTLTLRRKGMPPGTGEPAGGPQPLSGVEFLVPTLRAQIERASRDLNQRFGIDPSRIGRSPDDLYSPDELREVCELTVLTKLYWAVARRASDDVWRVKAIAYKEELDEVLARLAVRWGPTGEDRPATMRVGRISR